MLAPKKEKHRKTHRPDVRGRATKGNAIAFGSFALQAITGGWIKSQQIEAARRVLTRYLKRGGKMWIRIFPHQPITNKGSQSVMGGGKGVPEYHVAVVKPGNVIFELDGVILAEAQKAIVLAGHKLPIKCRFIAKK